MTPALPGSGLVPGFAAGLPTHTLVLHAVVVLLPLTALLLVVCAFSDAARRRAGLLLPVAGLGSLLLVPVATSSGEALMARLPADPGIAAHAAAGEAILPWAVGLALMCVAVWWIAARARHPLGQVGGDGAGAGAPGPAAPVWRSLPARSAASVLLAVLATGAAVGTTVRVVHAGHLGAQSTWGYVVDMPAPAGEGG
ncbi:hypothetical protein CLV92_12124 [Kineococcus xinjiangensis]|uniref:DUF2231 domain-containing protein n=1 Tax=Kineococcus xinjiangensis TaxID=512762 RepID=A0A2S6ICF0_9ACTN|nr:DUF2231 domain-containing protein [Kineococcus xinjiangensis]PPK90894.1 hypothetical protein CLV92_12124 [Kineococcus xinjiangensis]